MQDLVKKISDIGVVPVIKIDRAEDAIPLANALKKGGLCCAEVTFRTDAAEEAIRLIHNEFPDFLMAAGTVLTPSQADAAMRAG
ncbi:MAG: keto-hydroxyglutarate-aldolase/keto-deoxy-phosphogluconate aldolase, partial [Clostridia bacterium]|nr:keto-hydroxyglutarate-aldolase/keto-deoxy-phosphogluconate aldolase [Clostridia bacterium]